MEKENNKKVLIFIIVILSILVVVLASYILYDKIINDAEIKEDNIVENEVVDKNDKINPELKDIKRYLIYLDEDNNEYYFSGLEYNEPGGGYRDEDVIKLSKIECLDEVLYSHIYIDETNVYLSYINNNEYIIKKIDLTKGNGNYVIEEYKKINMPFDYKKCGTWLGSEPLEIDHACAVKSYYYNDYVYFFTRSSEYKEAIYVYNISDNNVKLIYTSENTASLKREGEPELIVLNDEKFVFRGIDGIFYSDLEGNNLKIIMKNEEFGNRVIQMKIIDNELYYNFGKYYEPDNIITYKYDFKKNKNIKVDIEL